MEYVFLYLNVVNDVFTGAEYEINCSYIRSYLESKGIKSSQLIYRKENSDFSMEKLVRFVGEKVGQAKLVLYINEYNYYVSKVLANQLKILGDFTVLCLGPSTEYVAEHLHKELKCDLYLYSDVYDALSKLTQWSKTLIHHEIYQNKEGAFIFQNKNIAIPLSEIPHPYSNQILPPEEIFHVGIYSSRGCFGKCCFCSYAKKCEIESYSVESVLDELEYVKNHVGRNSGMIMFLDDCFSKSQERIEAICKGICDRNINYHFWCTTRADVLEERLLPLLKQADFTVVVGMETASKVLLSQIGKTLNDTAEQYLDKIATLCERAKSIGLSLSVTVMFMLPQEGIFDINETLSFLKERQIKNVSFNLMTIFPSSRIYPEYQSKGFVKESPQKLNIRTTTKNYDLKLLWKMMIKEDIVRRQLNLTSKIRELEASFVGAISGMNSQFVLESTRYVASLECDEINDTVINFLRKNGNLETDVYIVAEKLNKGNFLFCDDRKHIKIEIEQFDKGIEKLYANNIYCERLSLIIEDGKQLKLKAGNYYESGLMNLDTKCIESASFEEDIVKEYENFLRKTEHSMEEIRAFVFRNSCRLSNQCSLFSKRRYSIKENQLYLCGCYLVEANEKIEKQMIERMQEIEKECKDCEFFKCCSKCPLIDEVTRRKVCQIRRRCSHIGDITNMCAFIMKNLYGTCQTVNIYSHDTHPDILQKNVYLILSKNSGILYIPQKRRHLLLSMEEVWYLKSVIYEEKVVSLTNPCMKKVMTFSKVDED